MPHLNVIDHPVIRTKLSELRDAATGHRAFRGLVEEVAMLMTYEITRTMPTRERPVTTPLEPTTGFSLARPVCLVPILRAGLGMTSGVMRLIPDCRVGHVGLERDEQTAEAGAYYHKLPPDIATCETIVTDPMLATGGSAVRCVRFLKEQGVPAASIRFMCLVAAPEGVAKLGKMHPDVPIFTAALDRELDDRHYIRPGLGDAGDRIFGT
jgi:uracil phosphoribosyltransferase